jgi:spore coat polysaccharide biosynthesis predicted glycosyltransferase SpsG/CMP-N-acetylneuraminic acid synthetase
MNTVAVYICASGKNKELPKKFVRDLVGKPLLSYSLDLAMSIVPKENILLHTDNEEIQLIAHRKDVACTLSSDVGDLSFNSDVILSHFNDLQKKKAITQVIWLSPSTPLLNLATLKKAITTLKKSSYDSIFSVSEKISRAWKYNKGYHPSFNVFPSHLGTPMHDETGAFFIMKSSSIHTKKGYTSKNTAPYPIPQNQAIDIWTFQEWWVAERLLKRKKIVVVVAGHKKIGTGHIVRTSMLAQELINHEIHFLCTAESDLAKMHLLDSHFTCTKINTKTALTEQVLALEPDMVINDILNTNKTYISALRKNNIAVVNFEDKGSGAPFANCVISSLHDKKEHPNMLVGHSYFFLRSEFYTAKKYRFKKTIKQILLTFGGTDQHNLSLTLLNSLLPFLETEKFKIVLLTGIGFSASSKIKSWLKKNNEYADRITWISSGTQKISHYMTDSDFAVVSAGRTALELAHLRVPSIVIASHKRESEHGFLKEIPFTFLGEQKKLTETKLKKSLGQFIKSESHRSDLYKKLSKLHLDKGKNRVLKILNRLLRSEHA